MKKTLAITSDHAGFDMKKAIINYLDEAGIAYEDLGAYSSESSDYPDFGHKMGEAISSGAYEMGITICGSGNGINMVTNKHQGIRGALCWSKEISRLARSHNDANICSLPARFLDFDTAKEIVDVFLETEFEGGRHVNRIAKIPIT